MSDDFLKDIGAGPRGKVHTARKKLRLATPVAMRKKGVRFFEQGLGAFLGAQAQRSAVEGMRPNCAYSLISGNPAAPIPAGGPTGLLTFSLPEDTWIAWFSAANIDADNFLCSSLKVAGYDYVKGSPMNLAGLLDAVNRIDRPGPLTGRKFSAGVSVEGNFLNISGNPAVFRGITVHCISTQCVPSGKKAQSAPSVLNFSSLARAFRSISNHRAGRRIR